MICPTSHPVEWDLNTCLHDSRVWPMPPPEEDAIFLGGCWLWKITFTPSCRAGWESRPPPPPPTSLPPPIPTREGRLMGWLPFFSWLPGTKYIFFLIGPAADGYLASRESERDFVSNAEK